MPSYSLANWDGSQSKQNQQIQPEKTSNNLKSSLTFGPPTRLLPASKLHVEQNDTVSGTYPNVGMEHRVRTSDGGERNMSVSFTARVNLLSPRHNTSLRVTFERVLMDVHHRLLNYQLVLIK
jgi:hypothetical protein